MENAAILKKIFPELSDDANGSIEIINSLNRNSSIMVSKESRLGERVNVITDDEDNPLKAQSAKWFNVLVNIKGFVIDLIPEILTLPNSNSLGQWAPKLYKFLAIYNKHSVKDITIADAEVLLAIVYLSQEKDDLTNDAVLEFLDKTESSKVLKSLQNLEDLRCIQRDETRLQLVEEVEVTGFL